jgi:hypothetical protein
VGEVTQEEISVGGGDQHYGYPFEEGNQVWGNLQLRNCSSMTPARACTPPAYGYSHAEGESVTGGLILDGPWVQVFGGQHYVFGDFVADWIRALPVSAGRTGVASSVPVTFASYPGSGPVSFRTGPDGSLYAVMHSIGTVYRFTPIGLSATVPTLPGVAAIALLAVLAMLGAWRLVKARGGR